MSRSGIALSIAGILTVLTLIIVSCGGGGTTPIPSDNNGNNPAPSQTTGGSGNNGYTQTQDSGGGFIQPPQGVMQYDGRQDTLPPISGGGKLPPQAVEEEFGKSIVILPQSSSGENTLVLKNFMPGQKVVMVTTNLDRNYLDFTRTSGAPGLPFVLPDSYYTFTADNLQKVTNSLPSGNDLEIFDISAYEYDGIRFDPGDRLSPSVLAKREIEYAQATGYLDLVTEVPRSISTLSKGIVRTFTSVDATIQMPPIEDPEDQQGGTNYQYPWIYQYQDGRLVGIGAHCYVFLSTEINNGYADGVKFTESRIQRFVQEFDSKIFPTSQAAFGPVRTYNEETVYFAPDRNVRLTPDDFDEDGNILDAVLPVRDDIMEKDQRIVIVVLNGVAPGGGGFYLSPSQRPQEEEVDPATSPFAQAPEINYDAFSTIYLDPSNFPADSDDWSGAYSVLAHEFQHKLHSDNAVSTSTWFNESLSMLNIYVNGYTVEKGTVIDFFIGQLNSFMAEPNIHSMFNDISRDQEQGVLYAPWFLFMLYVMEHYGAGTIREFYTSTGDAIDRLEGATGEPARYIFQKWILANYIDGLDVPERNFGESDADYLERVPLADPRFRYATFDMKGRIGTSNNVLPGVKVNRYPETEKFYPVSSNSRLVKPWCSEYVLFENGTGGDLRIKVNSDPNYRTFVLPINYNTTTSSMSIDASVYIP